MLEAYSVLTRLPSGLAVPGATAARLLGQRFRAGTLRLSRRDHASLVVSLAEAGVFGGASYDGLVALQARAHDCTLLTLDRRAQATYQRLGAAFRMIDSAL
jgi:hypothetical protein